MENLEAISAPPPEAQLNPDHEQAKQHVADYTERYLEYKTRYERTLVKTKHGQRGGDSEVEAAWGIIENHMNKLLGRLYEQNVKLGLNEKTPELTEVSSLLRPPTEVGKPDYTVVRFQMPGEPIPEYHDEYIVIMDDEDLGRGRKYDV